MEKLKDFLHRKDIEISVKRYGIDALGAMAQGLFCSLLIGTIINTLGSQLRIPSVSYTHLNEEMQVWENKKREVFKGQ